jgi:hypothetical protein
MLSLINVLIAIYMMNCFYIDVSGYGKPVRYPKPAWVSGTIIRGTLKTPNSQLVTPISIKLQRSDGCD